MIARLALEKDHQQIYDLLMLDADEHAMAKVNPDKVWAKIRDANSVIGVIDAPDGSRLVGLIMLSCQEAWWYSDEQFIVDHGTYLLPAFRHEDNFTALIAFAKSFAEAAKMRLIMGVLTNKRAEAKMRLFRRHMPCVGAIYLHGDTR